MLWVVQPARIISFRYGNLPAGSFELVSAHALTDYWQKKSVIARLLPHSSLC